VFHHPKNYALQHYKDKRHNITHDLFRLWRHALPHGGYTAVMATSTKFN
jgi:hypothetical protein